MIPVRLPADYAPLIIRDDCLLGPDHLLYGQPCAACDEPIGADHLPVALVAVGIAPSRRKTAGWVNGAAVAVHTACARPPTDVDAVRREPFLVTVHDQITGEVEQRRVPLDNYMIIQTGRCIIRQLDVLPMQRTHVIRMEGVRQPIEGPG